jgi:ParB family chromosome partitioning protein
VRHDVELDPAFVADIAARGVRQPIPVRRTEDGRLVVRMGKRRTLAAVEAGLARVRVYVEPDADPDEHDRQGQADRVIDQLAENEHRAGMTEQDRVRAHQQLLDLGLTVGQIARRTKAGRGAVQATHAVARSELARQAMARYELTIDQAAAIAEFDTGAEADIETVKALTVTAKRDPQRFPHLLQRARDERAEREQREARERELAEAGVVVVTEEAVRAGGGFSLDSLRPLRDDDPGTVLSEVEHRSCPGHAVYVRHLRAWEQGEDDSLVVVPVCTDPQTHGHGRRWGASGDFSNCGLGSDAKRGGPMSEEEKQERRRVIANNKAWDSATTVRRQWLASLLTRKTPPKDAHQFLAGLLVGGSHDVRRAMESHHGSACVLLGLPEPKPGQPNPLVVQAAGGEPREGHADQPRGRARRAGGRHQPGNLAQPDHVKPDLPRAAARVGIRPQRGRADGPR